MTSSPSSSPLLDQIWSELVAHFDIIYEVSEVWLSEVKKAHDSHICYDLPYLNSKLGHFQEIRPQLTCPYSLFLGLVFQSFHYDTKASDNAEKNIEEFGKFAKESGLNKDNDFVRRVNNLIQLSVGGGGSTDDLPPEDEGSSSSSPGPGGGHPLDQHFFLDINFIHLADEVEAYEAFRAKTREEYSFLNDKEYKSLRLKVLQSFLLIPNIFITQEFRIKYEEKARENIQKEIDGMK